MSASRWRVVVARRPLPRRGRARDRSRSSTGRCRRSSIRARRSRPTRRCCIPAVGSNLVSDRRFRYGDPEAAFAAAPHRIAITVRYPRNSGTPIECFVVIAEYLPARTATRSPPISRARSRMHPVMALALKVSRQPAAAQDAARFRRQLRRQARGVSLYRADGARGAQGRPAGQMGRRPARASRAPRPRRPTG